jgi:hypothetical protein
MERLRRVRPGIDRVRVGAEGVPLQAVHPLRLATAILAIAALSVAAILATSDASAKAHHRGGNATIEMKFDGKHAPFFKGDDTVKEGSKLTIINKSDPQEIGPHTFSVATREAVQEVRTNKHKCGHFKLKVCANVFKAHKVGGPPDFPVDKPNVDNGKNGWDAEFSDSEKKGDTWFAGSKNEKTSRTVKVKAGEKLHFFCLVHPEMVGKIEVVK